MASRRKLIELTAAEIGDYLDAKKTLIIVSNGKHGYPHAMPMWFTRDAAGCLYCTTYPKSQKVLNWRRDPRATLLVESGLDYNELKGVMIYANCEVINQRKLVADTLMAINTGGRKLDAAATAKLRKSVAAVAIKRVVLKFTPTRYISWDHAKLGGQY